MENKLKLKKIKLPKVNFKKLDWSKWNFRKFNWTTLLAILAYLPVLTVLPLIFGMKNSYLSFHTKQGLVLHLVWLLFIFSFFFPVFPWLFLIISLFLMVTGIINAATGHERKLPVIGQLI